MITLESLKIPPFTPRIIQQMLSNYDEQKILLNLIYESNKDSGKKEYTNFSFDWNKNPDLVSMDVFLNYGNDEQTNYEKLLLVPIEVNVKKLYPTMNIPSIFNIYSNEYFFRLLSNYN